jgi:hypothetical protein
MSEGPERIKPSLSPPENWDNRKELAAQTLFQIEKDFLLQGLEISLRKEQTTYPQIIALLATELERIDLFAHTTMPGLLYQIDLPEKQVAGILKESAPAIFYPRLAEAIIKRCFQKVWFRYKYNTVKK